ncbi:histidine phosphatase family protein [Frankia sp. Cppng1_Ct_nod]|uniref:histidine phosphatase family protein n=1 Tax=Frankia sp. Cppng1_Ct_nod TaxID=2897162 RepID=UPI00104196DE|nr:histidine phosphatase family protein [Frankia sp. Cppng1_Ct_nod]
MAAVYLVRHGQASFGKPDYDRLSDRGHRQSRLIGVMLRQRGVVFDKVCTGAMRRHRETATDALAGWAAGATRATGTGRAPECDERWNEYNTEDVIACHAPPAPEGTLLQPTPRVFQALLDAALTSWIEAGDASGCAETWPVFAARVRAGLEHVLAGMGSGRTALVFTSAGPITAVCASLLGLPPTGFQALNRVMVNASVTKVVAGRGGISLVSINEHAHLEGGESDLVTYR